MSLKETYASTKPSHLQDILDHIESAAAAMREAIKLAREANLDLPIQPVLDQIGSKRLEATYRLDDATYIIARLNAAREWKD